VVITGEYGKDGDQYSCSKFLYDKVELVEFVGTDSACYILLFKFQWEGTEMCGLVSGLVEGEGQYCLRSCYFGGRN
jgi:hypothetical protein